MDEAPPKGTAVDGGIGSESLLAASLSLAVSSRYLRAACCTSALYGAEAPRPVGAAMGGAVGLFVIGRSPSGGGGRKEDRRDSPPSQPAGAGGDPL